MQATTKRRSRDHRATIRWSHVATLATYVVATLPAVPALMVNVELARGKSAAWMAAAVVMVAMAAVAAEAGRLAPGWWQKIICALVAVVLTWCNILNAATNATNHSDQKSDHRRAIIAAAKDRETQVAAGRIRRAAQVAIAGEVPPATIEAEIAALTATNSGRWQATEQCSAARITVEPSRAFCADVGRLTAKLAAAKERDKIDAKLATLGTKGEEAEPTPASADAYSENASLILSALGVEITEDRKKVITASRDWLIALGIEIMAALGPMIVVIVITRAGRHTVAPVEPKPAAVVDPPERPAPNPIDDPVYAFIATAFERKRGAYMKADDPWQLWLAHCAENSKPAGSQRAFGLAMKACHSWERNHNRPRYVNVAPRLGVVGSRLASVA